MRLNINVQEVPGRGKIGEVDLRKNRKPYFSPEGVYTQENVGEEENVTEGISG